MVHGHHLVHVIIAITLEIKGLKLKLYKRSKDFSSVRGKQKDVVLLFITDGFIIC